MLLTFLSSFGQTFFISVFAADIQNAYGLSHGGWGLIYTLGTTASALVMVWAGRQADVFRVRSLGALALAALGVSCLVMAANAWVWLLPVIVFALRFTGQGMMSHIAAVAMARWFVATRGRALSIAALGFSFGQAFFPMIIVGLMLFLDWRWIWVLSACIAFACVPLLLRLLSEERTPAAMANTTEALGMRGQHWTRKQVLFHPLFWLMVPALMGPSAFNTAFFFHQVHYSNVIGITVLQFASYLPIYTAVTIGAMLAFGALLDRFGTSFLLIFHQAPMIGAFILFAQGETGLWFGFILLAVTAGGQATLISAFWAEFYGTAHLGAIKALSAAIGVFGSAVGPGLTGVLLDTGLSIQTQYVWIAGYFALTSMCMAIGILRARRDLTTAA